MKNSAIKSAMGTGPTNGKSAIGKAISASVEKSKENSLLDKEKTSFAGDAAVEQLKTARLVGLETYKVSGDNRSNSSNKLSLDTKKAMNSIKENPLISGVKSRLDELIDNLKELGLSNEEINSLRELMDNPDFMRMLERNPSLAKEMLETIKSDPFANMDSKINFNKDDYQVFSELDSTLMADVVKAGLGEKLNQSFESFATQNDYNAALAKTFLDAVLSNPETKEILSNNNLNEREKLQQLETTSAEFLRSNMVKFGAFELDGELKTSGQKQGEAKVIVFGDSAAQKDFLSSDGLVSKVAAAGKDIAFINTDENKNSLALAKSLGVDLDAISNGDYAAAVITKDGLSKIGGDSSKFLSSLATEIKSDSVDAMSSTSLDAKFTKDFDALTNTKAQSLDINSSGSSDSDAYADIYAGLILDKIIKGKVDSLDDGLEASGDSLAQIASQAKLSSRGSQKSGLKLDSRSYSDTLAKFSGLSNEQISTLRSELGENAVNAKSVGILLQAGKTKGKDLSANDMTVMSEYQKYEGVAGRNTKALYESDMKKFHNQGLVVDYLYDTIPGKNISYKQAAESIMNMPNDSRGFFDAVTGLNAIASVNTIAQILKNPDDAFKDGEGFYGRLAISDNSDYNNAFGINRGNHYVRGNEEAAMSLLSDGKLGAITIYGGNGMSDVEFTKRMNRLMRSGTELTGTRGQLASSNDNGTVRGLGLKHMSEEGHGSTNGNHGVKGSMDSGDQWRFKAYALLVKGDAYSHNCVACSNMGGGNSYGKNVLEGMSKHLGKHVRLYATGAEIPTPPKDDRIAHIKGHMAPSLKTNSDRLIVSQGQKEVSQTDLVALQKVYRDEYNITRVKGSEDLAEDLGKSAKQAVFTDASVAVEKTPTSEWLASGSSSAVAKERDESADVKKPEPKKDKASWDSLV